MIPSGVNIENKARQPDIILRCKQREGIANWGINTSDFGITRQNQENDQIPRPQARSEKILEAEECQSCTGDDEGPHVNDEEEPHRDIKNHPREYYYKRTTVESHPALIDDPEESHPHKTLRTENLTTWSMNRDRLTK